MIQSNPPTAAAQRTAEEVVGKLIGAEGIDLTLVGPLSSLAETATDRLTLETLAGDVAALDWQPPEAISQALASVNFQAQRAPHPHDEEAAANGSVSRRVYAFDMNRFRGSDELIAALLQLNARRQVRTFSIGLGGSIEDVASPANVRPMPSSGGDQAAPSSTPRVAKSPIAEPSGDSAAGSLPQHRETRQTQAQQEENQRKQRPIERAAPWQRSPATADLPAAALDLDDLLDQLDQADP